jgi:hypothetical protein
MFNVEDAQDAAAATHAREEYRLETAEFETETTAAGMSTVPSSSSIYDADIMSEQYLMLIKQVKLREKL